MILGQFWWFAIPGLILGLYAQFKLKSIYSRFVQVPVSNGMTGAQAARAILDSAGLRGMPVNEVPGHLTDHYDPTKKALFLSSENYHGYSVAAVGVAAHEAGHALQHRVGYAPLKARMWMVPATQFASYAWQGILLLGMIMGMFQQMLPIAIGIFAVITLFQVITLPVEFDASRRAKDQLFQLGLIRSEERPGVAKVLNAAALTYVAAMVSSVLTLLQLIMMARSGNDRS
ncbi:MAG TPA: zinc metallopeptidase [Methylomirabilota bacterium]|nr:zinc metallopeptidase [Methylomirabilota bacterium]